MPAVRRELRIRFPFENTNAFRGDVIHGDHVIVDGVFSASSIGKRRDASRRAVTADREGKRDRIALDPSCRDESTVLFLRAVERAARRAKHGTTENEAHRAFRSRSYGHGYRTRRSLAHCCSKAL